MNIENRRDEGLAFLLRYENVAWYDSDENTVKILDRRVYPREVRFEVCRTHRDVAAAIKEMVTQSAGPYTAAGMGMALAAREAMNRGLDAEEGRRYMRAAADALSTARPTTENRMRHITGSCLAIWEKGIQENQQTSHHSVDQQTSNHSVDQHIFLHTVESLNRRYEKMERVAEHLVDRFPEGGRIMTQCFGETIVGMMVRVAKKRGKSLSFYCPETRPYLQGARLTASVIKDQGYPVTVITDNMMAATLRDKGIDVFTSAADGIYLDGHVVNKVGTLQMAILAKYFGTPYFVTGIPDQDKTSIDDVVIEERDPGEVLEFWGMRTAMEGVQAYYPAFDITPPHLVSAVVTDRGVYTPYNVKDYFQEGNGDFY